MIFVWPLELPFQPLRVYQASPNLPLGLLEAIHDKVQILSER